MNGLTAQLETPWPELRGRQAVSSTTVHGMASVIFGLPFLAAGAAIMLVAADVIPVEASSIHAPRWVIGVFGFMFAVAGLSLVVHGLRGRARRQHFEEARQRHRDEPWMADHNWNHHGATTSGGGLLVRNIYGLVFMAVFLATFNWWAFASEHGALLVTLVVGFFDLIIAVILADTIYKFIRQYKYGRSRLRYSSFPFLLGDTLDAALSNPRGIGLYESLTYTLRCIQERYEIRGSGKNRSQRVILYEVYKDEQVIDGPGEYRGGDADLRIRFRLPDEDWETKLSERPPRYWSLQIKAKTPGVDFDADFLVPVYRKP